jgi:hypothetical protein
MTATIISPSFWNDEPEDGTERRGTEPGRHRGGNRDVTG